MRQFLAWVDERPRSYRDVADAWRSTCPMNSVWEDAVIGALVEVRDGGHTVRLTQQGRAVLKQNPAPRRRNRTATSALPLR